MTSPPVDEKNRGNEVPNEISIWQGLSNKSTFIRLAPLFSLPFQA